LSWRRSVFYDVRTDVSNIYKKKKFVLHNERTHGGLTVSKLSYLYRLNKPYIKYLLFAQKKKGKAVPVTGREGP
jgi:hypothetical protein